MTNASEEDEKAKIVTKHSLLWRPKVKFDAYYLALTSNCV